MAAYTKFNTFLDALLSGALKIVGTSGTLGVDRLKVYLTNASPNTATHQAKSDVAEISTVNGYTGAIEIDNAGVRASTVFTLSGTSIEITASGGSIGPFANVVLFDDTASGLGVTDQLICYWPIGSSITIASGDSFDIKFNGAAVGVAGTIFTLQ